MQLLNQLAGGGPDGSDHIASPQRRGQVTDLTEYRVSRVETRLPALVAGRSIVQQGEI